MVFFHERSLNPVETDGLSVLCDKDSNATDLTEAYSW